MDKAVYLAVCDDDEIICQAISDRIYSILTKCGITVSCDKFIQPIELYNKIKNGTVYDVLFLDIDMPGFNGIELAQAVKKIENSPDIIFVSNRDDKVFDTFKIRPFGFVRKNNFSNDLNDTLKSYISAKIMVNGFLTLKTNGNTVLRKLRIMDVAYIESFRYKQTIHMSNGEQIEVRLSMDELESKLIDYDIVRVHKGYLVNLKYVQRIEKTEILLRFKESVSLSVSREKVQPTKAAYLSYLRKTGVMTFDEK